MAKIVVVDDDPRVLKLLSPNLRRAGYEVHETTSPFAALDLARKIRPELMVIDWKMPDCSHDGLELLFQVRRDPSLANTRVVLIGERSSWYEPGDMLAVLPFAPDAVLYKPFNPMDLLAQVRQLIGPEDRPGPGAGLGHMWVDL